MAYEGGVKVQAGRIAGSLLAFDLELSDTIDRRTLIFDRPIVGTSVAGFEIVRQDAEGLSDARIGASRTRANIAGFFSGSAVDLGLVRNGTLLATGETLTQVQDRLLGAAASAAMFTSTPGFTVLGARVGIPFGNNLELTVIAENLLDRNYRLHGSGIDEPGFNLQLRTRVRF